MDKFTVEGLFTALEAESIYHDSPLSKLFVDRFVELFPIRWIYAETMEVVPAKRGLADIRSAEDGHLTAPGASLHELTDFKVMQRVYRGGQDLSRQYFPF